LVHETGDRKRPRTLSPSAPLANSQSLSPELTRKMKERVISGGVTFPVIGRYHEVAEKFLRLVERGRERIDGIALILVNYVNETPALQNEVLPRLEWPKVREGRL
jgi:alkanesulfonate monooxygenase SsuD/methylene tetrahydromethanopterin reductase-like flavin-dependent oxidoreductase (luciferase family)